MAKSKLRETLGAFMTGVTVVTAFDDDGAPWGVTANSFTSVSLEPPLILVCLGKQGRTYQTFARADRFAVNILSVEQKSLAILFASKTENRFTQACWTRRGEGAPVLPKCAAWLDCRVRERVPAGDHVILLGDVMDFGCAGTSPLGYCKGAFVTAQSMPLTRENTSHA